MAAGEPPELLKCLQSTLEQQQLQLKALNTRQSELSEENAALRDCLESLGILCGQSFLSRLHRRRFQRVLRQHPLVQYTTLEGVARTPELAVAVVSHSGPSSIRPLLLASRVTARGVAAATLELDRLFPTWVYVVGGASNVSRVPLRAVEQFSPSSGTTQCCAPMLTPRAVCAAVACGESIYAIAGRGAKGALNTVECYNPLQNVWLPAPPLQFCSGWVAATGAWAGICVAGGEADDSTSDSVEYLQPNLRSWVQLPPMTRPRWAAAAATTAEIAFVAGGHGITAADSVEVLRDFECLTLGADEWQRLPPMLVPRAAFALAAVSGKIYAVGGYGERDQPLNSLERFDLRMGCWEALVPLDGPRGALNAVGCGGKLYVFGGSAGNGEGSHAVIQCFSPTEGKWRQAGRIKIPRRCLGAAACRW